MQATEVVITGVGVVSSIAIGTEAFWEALLAGNCGLVPVAADIAAGMPPQLFGHVPGFEAKTYVANRKEPQGDVRAMRSSGLPPACSPAATRALSTEPSNPSEWA